VEFVDVRFRYPTRRDVKVLRNFTLSVKPGQTVAFVGTSGCGKSTCVALVERLYDINSGSLVRAIYIYIYIYILYSLGHVHACQKVS
jgi:ABC-type multidrug transport system fused ATPase/permease subunit